jgi:hypothetical protein
MEHGGGYGVVEYDAWRDLYGHRSGHEGVIRLPGYMIKLHDDPACPCTIVGRYGKDIHASPRNAYVISNGVSRPKSYSATHLILASAFPDVPPNDSVIHINGDHTDNRAANLRWATRSEGARVGQRVAVARSNAHGGRNGVAIALLNDDGEVIHQTRSVDGMATYLLENWVADTPKPQLKTVASKIRRAFDSPSQRPYGKHFVRLGQSDLEGEEWRDIPRHFYPDQPDKTYQASSLGRIRGAQGNIVHQCVVRNSPKYKVASVGGTTRRVHRLIWEAFNGEVPDGMFLLHDDSVPLNPDGTYRNYLRDLRLGDQTENMLECHASKRPRLT